MLPKKIIFPQIWSHCCDEHFIKFPHLCCLGANLSVQSKSVCEIDHSLISMQNKCQIKSVYFSNLCTIIKNRLNAKLQSMSNLINILRVLIWAIF